ncbi:Autoinducer 2 kinase LsrK [Raoultella planticola]|uniref:Autoinducer 2 kinase LsrK n=1 Tax=Raoultella planticola TaxID=575 RepID=A0A485D967_RAOPL|nr:Autoinducer 2 kinase LsrK [Raoultella planticola]
MSYLLALDAGTGSIRAVIFDLSGHQVAVGQAEWKHLSVENVPGSMEFDLTTNWLLACQCIRQALANAHLQAADIQSVACCSMREGIVLLRPQRRGYLGLRQRRCPRQPRSRGA